MILLEVDNGSSLNLAIATTFKKILMKNQNLDTIYIEQLTTEAIIGIYDWEKQNRQPLLFDIEMDLPIFDAAKSDDIDDTVDYKVVSDEIIELVRNSRFDLLESLCETICESIFMHHSAVKVIRLKVSKPQAVPQTKTVGIKITRYRSNKD